MHLGVTVSPGACHALSVGGADEYEGAPSNAPAPSAKASAFGFVKKAGAAAAPGECDAILAPALHCQRCPFCTVAEFQPAAPPKTSAFGFMKKGAAVPVAPANPGPIQLGCAGMILWGAVLLQSPQSHMCPHSLQLIMKTPTALPLLLQHLVNQ